MKTIGNSDFKLTLNLNLFVIDKTEFIRLILKINCCSLCYIYLHVYK